MVTRPPPWSLRSLVPLLVFIVATLLILFLVADRFLLPALAVSRDLEPGARKQMAALRNRIEGCLQELYEDSSEALFFSLIAGGDATER